MKKALLAIAGVIAIVGISAGTMIALAEFAPELLPKSEQGPSGPRGPKGDTGEQGVTGAAGVAGGPGFDASIDESAVEDGAEAREILERWCHDLYNASVYQNDNDSLAADLYNDCN